MSMPALFCKQIVPDCVYPISTERSHDAAVQHLESLPPLGNAVFGVSALATLNFASQRAEVSNIYIFDLANSVSHFWEKILPILSEQEDPSHAAQKIEEELSVSKEIYFQNAILARPFHKLRGIEKIDKALELATNGLRCEFGNGTSFLASPMRYSRIHDLAKQGRIHFYQADLADPRNVRRIAEYFQESRVVFDAVYLSNIGSSLQDLRSIKAFSDLQKELIGLGPSVPHFILVDHSGNQSVIPGRYEV